MSNEDNFSNNQQQAQVPVNLGQLFSDVSRTVSGFRNILGQADPINPELQSNLKLPLSDSQQMPSSNSGSGSPLAGFFSGSTCFKTCGMEDIQWAAKRAGELFITLKTCAIIMTVFSAIVVLLLAILIIYLTYKQYQQSLEYRSTTSSCSSSSYSPTTIENTSKTSATDSKRPFFTSALFHRRSDRSEERKGTNG